MFLRAGHAPKRVRQPGRDREDAKHLKKVCKRRWVLKRMGAIRIEKAAAVGSEFLDDFLRSNWSLRNRLLSYSLRLLNGIALGVLDHTSGSVLLVHFDRLLLNQLRRVVRPEVLHHALRDQQES